MFRFGVHRGLVESSPVQLLYRPGGQERPRERSLTDSELKALLKDPKAATRFERLSHAIVLFLLTAVRRSELALASWSEFDFKAKTWRIPGEHVKGRKGEGKGHTVPLWILAPGRYIAREAGVQGVASSNLVARPILTRA